MDHDVFLSESFPSSEARRRKQTQLLQRLGRKRWRTRKVKVWELEKLKTVKYWELEKLQLVWQRKTLTIDMLVPS